MVGWYVLPILRDAGWQVEAFSRAVVESSLDVMWRQLPLIEGFSPQPSAHGCEEVVSYWVCLTPIWVLPDYFALLEASGARRVVVLSSTSRFTKVGSGDAAEVAIAAKLADAEARVQAWAEARGIQWVVLRPTLIYGLGRDKNITEIARFVRRFGFFPVFCMAQGLRQPIHAVDVAAACVGALQAPGAANRAYNISGGETLSYRDMVARVCVALGQQPRLLTVPLWAFRLSVAVLRCVPRYRLWSTAMAERMNQNLVFDHADAVRDLGFKPKGFALKAEDMPLPAPKHATLSRT